MNIQEKICFIDLFRCNKTCHYEYFQIIVDIFSSYIRYILWGLFLMPWPVLQIICSLVHLGIKYCILSILWSCNTFSLRVFVQKISHISCIIASIFYRWQEKGSSNVFLTKSNFEIEIRVFAVWIKYSNS